jgi:hypothetical protein
VPRRLRPLRYRFTSLSMVKSAPAKTSSENVESSHQFLPRFHGLFRMHPAEHFLPALAIHCCEFAHELVPSFPFRIFSRADAEREQRGDDPHRNVCCGHEKHKSEKVFVINYKHSLALQRNGGLETAAPCITLADRRKC